MLHFRANAGQIGASSTADGDPRLTRAGQCLRASLKREGSASQLGPMDECVGAPMGVK